MTETEHGLLQAIYDNPDDDAVRLVYADFLEERGDPRGEFIRLQILHRNITRDPILGEREDNLLAQHLTKWTREAQPYDPKRVYPRFRRGFIDSITIEKAIDTDLEIFHRLPDIHVIRLVCDQLSPDGLRQLVTVKSLRVLRFSATPHWDPEYDFRSRHRHPTLSPESLAILETLPCWTRIVYDDHPPDAAVWSAFQTRRMSQFTALPASERRQAALRYFTALTGNPPPFTAAQLSSEPVSDPEMAFFAEIPELERIDFDDGIGRRSGLTAVGLQYLTRLPNLKSVSVEQIESIRVLTECTTLENLEVRWDDNLRLDDAGTEGLERLTNLRVLELNGRFSDATFSRLRTLRQLRKLKLDCAPLVNEDSLGVFAELPQLESVSLCARDYRTLQGTPHNRILRHFATLERLQELDIKLDRAGGDGLRHLAGLRELRFVRLNGFAVNDESIRHFASCQHLRTLAVLDSRVTETGARWLAERLPAVTIIASDFVIKSPCQAMSFRRHTVRMWASVLLPEQWRFPASSFSFAAEEDGWCGVYSQSDRVWPGFIELHLAEQGEAMSAETKLVAHLQRGSGPNQCILESNVISWLGWETASCIYGDDKSWGLSCVAIQGKQLVTLDCKAPEPRFPALLPLFLFVARSVCFDEAAREGIGELIEVPTAEIERLALTNH